MHGSLAEYIFERDVAALVRQKKFLRMGKLPYESLRAMVKPLDMCYLVFHGKVQDPCEPRFEVE